MRAELGFALLTIGTIGALLGVVTLAVGLITKRARLLDIGRRYVAVVLFAAVAAFVVMETALFAHDYSLQFVVDNVARATPGLYTFMATWVKTQKISGVSTQAAIAHGGSEGAA